MAVITEMLSQFRVVQPIAVSDLRGAALTAQIIAYNRVLLSMPMAMSIQHDDVRRHLVWKRMLAAAADGQVKFNKLTPGDFKHMWGHADARMPLYIPSWLSICTLAAQMQCPTELLFMWVSLWQEALLVGGAASAIFDNTAVLQHELAKHLVRHGHPPSPATLLQRHMQIAEGSDAVGDLPDAGGLPAKRRRLPTCGAEAPTEIPPEVPAEAPAQTPAGKEHRPLLSRKRFYPLVVLSKPRPFPRLPPASQEGGCLPGAALT